MEPKKQARNYIDRIARRNLFLHVRVTKVMRAKIDLRAKRAGMTVSDFVRMIIERYSS